MATSLSSLLGGLFQGNSGYSGVSGYSGQGLSGFSGYSGQQGASGFSGISGFSGSATPVDYLSPLGMLQITGNYVNQTVTSGQYLTPFVVLEPVKADNFKYFGSFGSASGTQATTAGTTTTAVSYAFQHGFAFYTQGTGTQSTALYSITSTAATYQLQYSVSVSASTQQSITLRLTYPVDGTTSQFTTQYSLSTSAIQYLVTPLSRFTGIRNIKVPFNTTLNPGEYWVAENYSTGRTGGGTQSIYYTKIYGINSQVTGTLGYAGAPGGTTNNLPWFPALGSITTGGSAFASAIVMANVSTTSSTPALHFQLMANHYSSL